MAASAGSASVDADLTITGSGMALAIARMATANFDVSAARTSPYKAEALTALQNICSEAENMAQDIADAINTA